MVSIPKQPNIFEITSVVARNESALKLALPVNRSVLLYSQYEYVRGTAPIGSGGGVSLSKLRALDNLIERLVRIHGKQPIVKHIKELNRQEVEGLIERYSKSLHRITTNPANALTTGSAWNDVALTLNLVA